MATTIKFKVSSHKHALFMSLFRLQIIREEFDLVNELLVLYFAVGSELVQVAPTSEVRMH